MKDVIAAAGLPLTASSRLLEGNIAAGDATVWRLLREQGAVLMGHAHTDEFGLTTTCPQVGNPWDSTAIVGGSSGGSAAVVAARFAPPALGADTGGSLRIPDSRREVSAIKPSFGRVSKYGVIPVSWTTDHVGTRGHGIADAALLLSAIAGGDPQDPVTLAAPPPPGSPSVSNSAGGPGRKPSSSRSAWSCRPQTRSGARPRHCTPRPAPSRPRISPPPDLVRVRQIPTPPFPPSPSCRARPDRRSGSQASFSILAASSAPVSGSRAMTAMVSSPAIVPTTYGRAARSSALAR